MAFRADNDEEDDLSNAGSDTSFDSHCSDLSDCLCEDCLEAHVDKPIWSPVVPYRDGDTAKIRQNVLVFMMEARRRQLFSLLALPIEVRFLILRRLLYHEEPIDVNIPEEGDYQNFTFYPQILATCRQLHEEGSTILMQQNTFTMFLYGNEYHRESIKWMDFDFSPSINPRMERSAYFELIINLEVNICFEDCGGHLPLVEAAAGHRLLVYELVDKILSRSKRLSSLSIRCLLDFIDEDFAEPNSSFETYRLKGLTAEPVVDDEPSTIEQYILEPLANLPGATDTFAIQGMTAACEEFLDRRIDSIEQFERDQKLRIDIISKHRGNGEDGVDAVYDCCLSEQTEV